MCRDLNNYEFRCNCRGTNYKGLQCEIGAISIPQIPILTVGQTVTITVKAYPRSELFLSIFPGSNAVIVNPSAILFTQETTTASISIAANVPGIHFLQFNTSGIESPQFERPKPMMVIVRNGTYSNHTLLQYLGKSEQLLGNYSQGCCEKEMSAFSCSNENSSPAFVSSCSWEDGSTEETFGVVAVKKENLLLPLGVVGAHFNDYDPLLTLPIGVPSCTACSSQCSSYEFTVENVIDLIKSHTLGRSFLSYSKDLLPSWITLQLNAIDPWDDDSFSSFDTIVDIVHGKEVILIDGCEDLNIPINGLYAVLRYNDSLKYSVDGIDYFYLSQYGDDPVCFAIDICSRDTSPFYISVPEGHHKDLEQLAILQVRKLLLFEN